MPTPPPHGDGPQSVVASTSTRSRRLGRVALIVALVVLVGATVAVIVARVSGNPFGASVYTFGEISGVGHPDVAGLYSAIVLPWTVSTVMGFLLAIWALVQGIVAVASRRGRMYGALAIAVIVIAVIVFITGLEAARGMEIHLKEPATRGAQPTQAI
ncbi:hypothetical protein [Leifsonia poae]|nr:hypothetical protein [Leifsonia poae]